MTRLQPVNRSQPCEICGGDHKCSRGSDRLIICGRPPNRPPSGYRDLGPAKGDEQFHLFRIEEHPPDSAITPPIIANAHRFAADLTPDDRCHLAVHLCLPEYPLWDFNLGYCKNEQCWTIAEVDGYGRVVGILRRWPNRHKKRSRGSISGLTVPLTFNKFDTPLFCPEGFSNTAAMTAMRLNAVGRPNNLAGVEHLAVFIRTRIPRERPVCIVGDNDVKPDGTWPGFHGAETTAEKLRDILGRSIFVAMPPKSFKGVHDWAIAQNLPTEGEAITDDWTVAGERLLNLF